MSCGFSKVLFSATTGSAWFKWSWNRGATTERLCGTKRSLGFSLNWGLWRRVKVSSEKLFCKGAGELSTRKGSWRLYGLSTKRFFLWEIYGHLLRVLKRAVLGVFWGLFFQRNFFIKRRRISTRNRRKRPKRDPLQIWRFPSFSAIEAEGLVKVLWVFGIEVNNVEKIRPKNRWFGVELK